jgi:signal transduction histidine kinase
VVPTSRASSNRWLPGVGASLILLVGIAFGVISEEIRFGLTEPQRWVQDFVVGLGLLVLGLLALQRVTGTGGLLIGSGYAWWMGNLAPAALYVHRGLLLHAIATYPGWRTSRTGAFLLATAYLGACLPALASTTAGTAVYGLAVTTIAVSRLVGVSGLARRQRLYAGCASLSLLVGTTGTAILRIMVDTPETAGPALLIYEISLLGAATLLVVGLRRPPIESITDLVVELEDTGSPNLRDTMARLLGDPMLEIGFRNGDGRFVDTLGTTLELPAIGSSRVATPIELTKGKAAVIIHNESLSSDGVLLDAISTVTRLSASNAQLNADARSRLIELTASRRRLLVAEEDERRRLSGKLRDRTERPLAEVEGLLTATVGDSMADPVVVDSARSALDQLRLATRDLDSIVWGLLPWGRGDDLGVALEELAARSPIPIELDVATEPINRETASTVYYVCSEAVTNTLKHAGASHIQIEVHRGAEGLTILVCDDGSGGADPTAGTGLQGLMDRVSALGGDLTVESRPGTGTRLAGRLPFGAGQ